jgi:heat shock protein HslJ
MVLSPIRQAGIENRRWRIAKYRRNDTDAKQEEGLIEAKSPGEVTFLNGQIYGSPGCGGLIGTYRVSGEQLASDVSFDLGGLCSSAGLMQDGMVLTALKGERRIEQNGDHILLRDRNGKAQILLVPF